MNDDRKIPEGRTTLYYIGNGLMVVGFLLVFSLIAEGMLSVGNSLQPGFGGTPSGPDPTRAIIGFIMFVAGGICRGIGAAGLAGSGVVLDPQRAREDMKPWSKMSGGMLNDALEEVEVVQHLADGPETVVKVRCPACRTLNDEDARYCKQCSKALLGSE